MASYNLMATNAALASPVLRQWKGLLAEKLVTKNSLKSSGILWYKNSSETQKAEAKASARYGYHKNLDNACGIGINK